MFLTLQQELEGWGQQGGQWFGAGAQSSWLSVDPAVQICPPPLVEWPGRGVVLCPCSRSLVYSFPEPQGTACSAWPLCAGTRTPPAG